MVDRERFDLPIVDGVELPTARPYILLDDDASECRSVGSYHAVVIRSL